MNGSLKLVIGAVVCILASSAVSFADIVYTTANSDGLAIRDWSAGVTTSVDRNDDVLCAWHDSFLTHWQMPVFQFPISSFHGWDYVQATLNLYNNSYYVDYSVNPFGDFISPGGLVSLRYYGAGNGFIYYDQATSGQFIAPFDASNTGWTEFDVSDAVNDAIDNGFDWVVFNFHVPSSSVVLFAPYEDSWGDGPWLEINETTAPPEPATLLMLTFGALPLLRRCRRRA